MDNPIIFPWGLLRKTMGLRMLACPRVTSKIPADIAVCFEFHVGRLTGMRNRVKLCYMVPKLKLLTQQLIINGLAVKRVQLWTCHVLVRWRWLLGNGLLRLWTLFVYQGCLVSHSSGIWDISRMAPWLQQVWPVAPVDSLCQVKAFRGPMGSQLCWGLHLPCAGLQCPISFWAKNGQPHMPHHENEWIWMVCFEIHEGRSPGIADFRQGNCRYWWCIMFSNSLFETGRWNIRGPWLFQYPLVNAMWQLKNYLKLKSTALNSFSMAICCVPSTALNWSRKRASIKFKTDFVWFASYLP